MDKLTNGYLMRAELWLVITTLTYFLMNGAQIFETVVLVPRWSAAPPESFYFFKGKYGIDLKMFWIVLHSIHEITFIAAIVFCWQLQSVRNPLLLLFTLHFAVRIWTIGYFAPNIIYFQSVSNGAEAGELLLLEKVKRWRTLNYLRVGLFLGISVALLPLCSRVLLLLKK